MAIIRNYSNLDIIPLKLAFATFGASAPDMSNYLKTQSPKQGGQIAARGINFLTDNLSNSVTGLFDNSDSEWGRAMGTLFSSGVGAAGDTMSRNLMNGTSLTQGLGKDVGNAVTGAGVGLASNYIGQGISSLGGNSKLSKALGAGTSTALGTVGGTAASNLINTGKIGKLFGTASGMINPYGLAMNVAGSALGAAMGPSKEYGGKYGKVTQAMDLAYDAAMVGVNAVPGFGLLVSGAMALNKGLSNLFGSTSGMTFLDAFVGSAFTPAPIKWLNMAGANTTSKFNDLSWLNSERTKAFMGNAFGNLQDKFDKAAEEAGKTYGGISQGAYRQAQRNIDFANQAWLKILKMTDLNELQNIRSQYMSSINNLKYAQDIQGGWSPVARGKLGMKIFNNATNHNIGMRLLSGAALIDNKQMILCSAVD